MSPFKPSPEQEEMGELEPPATEERCFTPDEVGVVMLLPLHQLRVSPAGESIQVGPSWGGHRDLVTVGPDLQPHQSDEGPQRLVDLRATRREAVKQGTSRRSVVHTELTLQRGTTKLQHTGHNLDLNTVTPAEPSSNSPRIKRKGCDSPC